jgi:hypothetical protein
MQYDPIQAFLSGVTSTFARMLLVVISFLLALTVYGIGQTEFSFWMVAFFPFVTFGTIFAWGASGIFFPVGLLSIIGFLFLAWKFIDTADPKLLFLLLFTFAAIYFFPLTWQHDYALWKLLCAAGSFYFLYFFLGYLLPAVTSHFSASHKA